LLEEWDYSDYKLVDEDEEPDPEYQRLLRNMRAHEIAMIVVKHRDLKAAASKEAYLKVLEKVYIFLIKFVRKNSDNQIIMLKHIDEFLQDIVLGVHALELIAEILRDNPKLQTYNIEPIIVEVCS